jgi:hypothetical protein
MRSGTCQVVRDGVLRGIPMHLSIFTSSALPLIALIHGALVGLVTIFLILYLYTFSSDPHILFSQSLTQ